MTSLPDSIEALGHWRDRGAAAHADVHGDRATILQRLEALAPDGQASRQLALLLADGVDRSRLDEHDVLEDLASEWTSGVLVAAGSIPPALFRLVGALAPSSAAPLAASGPRTAAVAPPAADDAVDLDVAAQVVALVAAAQSGVPFCEECARAAAQAAT